MSRPPGASSRHGTSAASRTDGTQVHSTVFTATVSSRAAAIHPVPPLAARCTICRRHRAGRRSPRSPRSSATGCATRAAHRPGLRVHPGQCPREAGGADAARSAGSARRRWWPAPSPRGKAPARADRVASGRASACATRPPSRPESSLGEQRRRSTITTGKMLVNACAASVIARSNGSSRFIWRTTASAKRTRDGGERRWALQQRVPCSPAPGPAARRTHAPSPPEPGRLPGCPTITPGRVARLILRGRGPLGRVRPTVGPWRHPSRSARGPRLRRRRPARDGPRARPHAGRRRGRGDGCGDPVGRGDRRAGDAGTRPHHRRAPA